MTNKTTGILSILMLASVMLTSCEAIGSIFKAGFWTGAIGIILLVLIIIYIIAKVFSRKS